MGGWMCQCVRVCRYRGFGPLSPAALVSLGICNDRLASLFRLHFVLGPLIFFLLVFFAHSSTWRGPAHL